MKIFISAIALAFAVPAAVQAAPAVQLHQAQSHQQGAAAHAGHVDHAGHQMPKGGEQVPHKGHAMGGCCADKNGDGKMDCCKKMAATSGQSDPKQPAQPQAHQNH